MTAQAVGRVMWTPDPMRQRLAGLVDGSYQLAADSDERLVLTAPFEIDLAVRDITP